MLRVLLADDHPVVREGLRALLETHGLTIAGEAENGRQAVELARSIQTDVAILDIGMPELNGLDALRAIRREAPNVRVVLLTIHDDDAYVVEGRRLGALGFVLKSEAGAELLSAVQAAASGRTYLSPRLSSDVVEAMAAGMEPVSQRLTDREREVLQLISEGQTTKEAASMLGISVKTAGTHRTNIMRKLGVHETAGLVRYAIRQGLIRA
ncbi:MAG: response regulator transcription factor [Candidatus Eisenbacteria bacterium]|uniref:Response regulator transcription factor n=1 Tax=Eiseniibacteriota bacterium TaxID=2212470 RepID=A0A538U6B7_UNCEI|nr:MAG: response regulator transcription factor [Candidatus Eisenbacteria bacterium]